jgi:parallel beta-helix repeat protein
MKQPAANFSIAIALGATIFVPDLGAEAAPTEIATCQTISKPGHYVLTSGIIPFLGTCFLITTSHVTLDLAGFLIAGRGDATAGRGSPSSPLRGITVRNGSFEVEAGTAVNLPDADGSIVEGLDITFISFSGAQGILAKGIVRGNTVQAETGVEFPLGISASGVVTDNYVSGLSQGTGISASGTVRGNTATNNQIGIVVEAGSTVIGNTATNNSQVGIEANCPSVLVHNTATNNGTNLVLNGQGCINKDNAAP